jgi:hypothetical protein
MRVMRRGGIGPRAGRSSEGAGGVNKEFVMQRFVPWHAVVAAAFYLVLVPSSPAGAADAPRKPKSAQTYSVYRDEGPSTQLDNPADSGAFEDLHTLTRHLIRSAAQLSKYPVPDALPMVTRIDRVELERRGCPESAPHCSISALYESTRGIMLAADLKPETNLFHRSILLHELVHYLQEVGRELATAAPCERWFQRELEAYALQNRFLASVYSPDRVSYGGGRPACDVPAETQTHRARSVKEADAVEQ